MCRGQSKVPMFCENLNLTAFCVIFGGVMSVGRVGQYRVYGKTQKLGVCLSNFGVRVLGELDHRLALLQIHSQCSFFVLKMEMICCPRQSWQLSSNLSRRGSSTFSCDQRQFFTRHRVSVGRRAHSSCAELCIKTRFFIISCAIKDTETFPLA